MVETLGGRAEALERVQMERGVDFSVGIEPGSVGLVEAWAEGTSWPQLMAGTSLDAGDIFRLLKRTVELLRQVAALLLTRPSHEPQSRALVTRPRDGPLVTRPSVEPLVMGPTSELSGARCRGRWPSCRTNPNPSQVALVPY